MTQSLKVHLSYGLLEGGVRHKVADLRDPTGHDEAMLTEPGEETPAERVSALIDALVFRVGDCERPSHEKLLQLTAGDRERLLFAVTARLLGPELDLVTPCPGCRNLVEMPVRFAELLAASPTVDSDRFELTARDGIWIARCRPVNGADLETAARSGPEGTRELIAGCVLELLDPAGQRRPVDDLPVECEAAVADALATLDPAAECRAEIDCPSCAARIDALADGFTLVRTALGNSQRLYDDVYRMARSYHWSEAEILSLPLKRRRAYLAIAEGTGARP